MNKDVDNEDGHTGEDEVKVRDFSHDDVEVTYRWVEIFESIIKNGIIDPSDKAKAGVIAISKWIEPSPVILNFLKEHLDCLQQMTKSTKETRKRLRDLKTDFINRIREAFPTEKHFHEHRPLIICALMYKTNHYTAWCEWIKFSPTERRTNRNEFKDKHFDGDEEKLLRFRNIIKYNTITRCNRLQKSLYSVQKPKEEEVKTAASSEVKSEAKLRCQHVKSTEVAYAEKSQLFHVVPPSQPVESKISMAEFLESEKKNRQVYEDSLEDSLQEG